LYGRFATELYRSPRVELHAQTFGCGGMMAESVGQDIGFRSMRVVGVSFNPARHERCAGAPTSTIGQTTQRWCSGP